MSLQVNRRLPESGRIRIGQKGDRGQPQRLSTFRLTSRDQTALFAASGLYGGDVRPWQGHDGEWEIITQTAELPILISPEEPSSWYELWSAGGCKRRCDGEVCTVPGPNDTVEQKPCMCDERARQCNLVTRFSFVLPDLPVLGLWRFDTGSYYASAELPEMIAWLRAAQRRGHYPEAILALETRSVVRNGKTKIFPVATIRVRQTVRELLGGAIATANETPAQQIEATPARALPAPPMPTGEPVEAAEPAGVVEGPGKEEVAAKRLLAHRKKLLKYYCDQCGMKVRDVVDKLHPEFAEIAIQNLTSEQIQAVIDNTTAEADWAKRDQHPQAQAQQGDQDQ